MRNSQEKRSLFLRPAPQCKEFPAFLRDLCAKVLKNADFSAILAGNSKFVRKILKNRTERERRAN